MESGPGRIPVDGRSGVPFWIYSDSGVGLALKHATITVQVPRCRTAIITKFTSTYFLASRGAGVWRRGAGDVQRAGARAGRRGASDPNDVNKQRGSK